MVSDPALSIRSTETRTGVPTLLLDTGSDLGTFRAHQTFRSAVGRRSNLVWLAGANTYTILFLLLAVRTTRIRITRVKFFIYRDTSGNQGTLGNGIPRVSIKAGTDGLVTNGVTDGIDATGSGTRVNTFVVLAGSVSWAVCIQHTLWSTG